MKSEENGMSETKPKKNRHYRVCAYCGKREYGDNVKKLMTLAPDGKHFRSEAHFAHKVCMK